MSLVCVIPHSRIGTCHISISQSNMCSTIESPYASCVERWGAGVETQKNVRGEIGGWGRVPFNETYAPS